MVNQQKELAWKEAKKRCRLNDKDIQLAKQLGMSPKSLIKNIPSPKEQWKAPVKQWIHELAEKKGLIKEEKIRRSTSKNDWFDDDDLPF